jgi:hypothetical protein
MWTDLSHAKAMIGANCSHVAKSLLILLAEIWTSVVRKEKVSCKFHSPRDVQVEKRVTFLVTVLWVSTFLIFLIIDGNAVRWQAAVFILRAHCFLFMWGCVCDFMAPAVLFLNEDTVNCSPWKADWNQCTQSCRKQFPPQWRVKSDGTPCSWKFAHQSKQTWKPLLIAQFTQPCSIFS